MTNVARPPPLIDDPDRLAALTAYDILDTPPEQGFDDLVEIARTVCEAGTAQVTFVSADRQWVKAYIGFSTNGMGLDGSICAHALAHPVGELLVIDDLARDPRTQANPLVTGGPCFRFYGGVPLRTSDGFVVGVLCVLDERPRLGGLTAMQQTTLKVLSRQAMALLDLRRASKEREIALAREGMEKTRRESLIATQAAVTDAAGDLGRILEALVASVLAAVPAADGGVIEFRDRDTLVYSAAYGSLAPHRGLRIPIEVSLSGHTLTTGKAVLCPDTGADPRGNPARREALGIRSAVIVPLLRAGETFGVLMLSSATPGALVTRDLETAELFASTVPLALAEAGQVEARRMVRDSERRHRAIFESAIDYAIVVLDLDGRITNWNEGARRILGWSAEETMGKPVDLFFTPEDRADDCAGDEMDAALSTGRGIDERWHLRKDGSRFWANGEMMTLRDDDSGDAIGFIKIIRDRTEQREARLELERQKRDLQIVLDTIPVGVLICEAPDARVIGGNRRLEEMVGHRIKLSADAAALDEWTSYHADGRRMSGEDLPLVRIIRHDLDHDEVECQYERPDGTRLWLHVAGAAIRDAEGALRGSVVAVSDISARRRADELQTHMNQELSHRMKNLLTIVQAITRQTIRTTSDPGKLQTTLSDRLMVLGSAHDILLGSSAERAPLAAVIRNGVGVLGEIAKTRLSLSGPDLDLGSTAALPLGLMMHELSTNAVKYGALSAEAGQVTVTWRVDADMQPPRFFLLWKETGGPDISEPTRQGFGSSLIVRGVAGLRGGKVTLAYPPQGVECHVEVWLSELSRENRGHPSGVAST